MSPLLLLGAGLATFFLLLKSGASRRRDMTEIVSAALVAINITGLLGLGWLVVEMLTYDGLMVFEIVSCAIMMALLAAFTGGGFALKRRGRTAAAIALLAVGAAPTILVYGFLVYLEYNPIDWR
jgi:maltodextrin utilization protein YvdJ